MIHIDINTLNHDIIIILLRKKMEMIIIAFHVLLINTILHCYIWI